MQKTGYSEMPVEGELILKGGDGHALKSVGDEQERHDEERVTDANSHYMALNSTDDVK